MVYFKTWYETESHVAWTAHKARFLATPLLQRSFPADDALALWILLVDAQRPHILREVAAHQTLRRVGFAGPAFASPRGR